MTSRLDQIISVFLNKKTLTLKDSEITQSLAATGVHLQIKDVRQAVQAVSPSLFQLTLNKNIDMIITVDPQIDICGPFLAGRCHNSVKPCGKLHLCREFGHCTRPKCTYPHDFKHGENRRIVEQFNCQIVNCRNLVQLIRLPNSLAHSESFIHKSHVEQQKVVEQDNIDRQIEVSYPSSSLAPQIDMEIIEMLLSNDGIRIEQKFNECENEYFRRRVIQLVHIRDIDRLLSQPIRTCKNLDIKFKRTKQFVDRTCFKLQICDSNTTEKITEARIRLYVSLLVGDNKSFTIYDLSTSDNQNFLIQYPNQIDFEHVRQRYETKRQLKNSDVILSEVLECDAVTIQYIDENKTMRYDDIERLIPSARQDIFTFEFTARNSAEIEFISVQSYRQWMTSIEHIKTKFQVLIIPAVIDVEENESNNQAAAESIPFNLNSSVTAKSQRTTVELRPDWVMVAAHPLFSQEYKDYIRENLGGEIEINGNQVTYTGSFPRLVGSPTNEGILLNKTNNYMQKLKYTVLRNLKPYHVRILHANGENIAFSPLNKNDYSIAGKSEEISRLKSKLFSRTNPGSLSNSGKSISNLHLNDIPPLMSPLNEEVSNQRRESIQKTTGPLLKTKHPAPSTILSNTSSIFPITTLEQKSMFSISMFEDRLQQHLNDTFNVKTIVERNTVEDKNKGEQFRIRLKVSGQSNDVESALDELLNLFSSLHTRKFDDKIDGNWTKITEATQMIQHHLLAAHMICSCQRVSPTTIYVNYFDITHPQFGVDEQKIEDLINRQFSLATIPYNKQSTTAKFTKEWMNLEESIRRRDDYPKDICLIDEHNTISLFGLTKLVKEFRQKFEQLKNQHVPQTCPINLSEKQLKYLKCIAKSDLNKLEKQYKADGCDISLIRLQQQRDFLAPPDMHEKIKASLEAIVQINEITFSIKGNAFEILIRKEPGCLLSLVKSKCYLEKEIQKDRVYINVPQLQNANVEDSASSATVASLTTNTMIPSQLTSGSNLAVGNSTINITIGDLASQTVDMIVICSTSGILRDNILSIAGSQVIAEFEAQNSNHEQGFSTSNGSLPCKRIFFLSWKNDPSDFNSLQPSVSKFVSTAIKYAVSNKYQSIAFPSIGCGKFGFPPSLIAQCMINETLIQLKQITSIMTVSFVLVSKQPDVYDEFVKYLQSTRQTTPVATPKTSSRKKHSYQSKIAYEEITVQIMLISTSKDHLTKCKQDILDLSQSASYTTSLTDKQDMNHWSQNTIEQYYNYCLNQNVIPTLDFNKCTVELVGPKDAVHEAVKYFYELTTETFKQARIEAVARGVIWSVETIPGSNTWQQYSYKLNGLIEDAFSRKLAEFDITNEKQQTSHIDFSKMEEQCESVIRRIRRKIVDSSLPGEWEPSEKNCIRVTLQTISKEYNDVLQKFNTTMNGHYAQIVKIERIQNIRWYKQYTAHRDDFQRRDGTLDERFLFHGCPETSADEIIQKSFNRSFAGVNGTAFGGGVYFHAHANYSHQYAKPNATGDRTMFLARVLIGKTTLGNQKMKTPPTGYDTTTDGKHIFVVYHDAGAYAEHLITYR